MPMTASDDRLFSPSASRNRDPILQVLRQLLPKSGCILEIASGSGEHITWFASHLPGLTWQPSDPDAAGRASIAAHTAAQKLENVLPPLAIDTTNPGVPDIACVAMTCCNMIHISPWAATEGLFALADSLLPGGSGLYLYGPFKRDRVHTAPSNATFDADLRRRNPDWGIRDMADLTALGERHGLTLTETIPMPANNFSLWFQKAVEIG